MNYTAVIKNDHIRTILRAASMMIIDADTDRLNIEKFSGLGMMRTLDLHVTFNF